MQITPEGWKQVKKLFESALDQAPAQRPDFLKEQCPDDAMRREVERLLENYAEAEAGNFLSAPAMNPRVAIPREIPDTNRFGDSSLGGTAGVATSAAVRLGGPLGNYQILPRLSNGEQLGPYRVVSIIGQGGMGLVYLAERTDGKFEQRVAIKVLQSGPDHEALGQRIHQECRILASLEHGNIARVLDADVTPDSLPYFVMEYVDGQPIDRYCDQHGLSVGDCMRLLLPVCDAVHVAHQKLIVHRDLKPDNILVTGSGTPKLLDFGIAKVLSEVPVSPQNPATRVLTPEYASPEQARGELVTTATDIYSLGGVLYKLLTGSSPHQLQSKSPVEAIRIICEEDVRKPSELRRELAGDIDSILLKALHTDPQRRYRSVDQFATDIRNFLEQKPVIARRDTVWYRSRKYVRRHALAVGFTTAIVVLLGVFSFLEARQLHRTREERDRATRITDFMTGMFKVSDPSQARGNTITAREILDKASKDIDKGMGQDPVQQAQMMHVMGTVYKGLEMYKEAESLLRKALDIRRRTLGSDNTETVETMIQLSVVTDRSEGDQLLRDAIGIRRRTLGPNDPDTLVPMGLLAGFLESEGRLSEADKLADQVMEIRSRVHVPDSEATMNSLAYLAAGFMQVGKYSQAEQLDRQILDFRRRRQDADRPDVLFAEGGLAWVLRQKGQWSEAESLLQHAVETGRRVLGPDHFYQKMHESMLAEVLGQEGRYEEAERLHREVLETRRRDEGPRSAGALSSMNGLAQVLINAGRYSEAHKLLREAAEISEHQAGGYMRELHLVAIAELGVALDGEGRPYEAEKLERESIDGLSETLGLEEPNTLNTTLGLATILMHEGHYEEAGKVAQQVQEANRHVRGERDPITAAATYTLARINARQGRADAAFSLLRESIDTGLAPNLNGQIDRDPDLRSLHGDARWSNLLANAKQHALAAQKTN